MRNNAHNVFAVCITLVASALTACSGSAAHPDPDRHLTACDAQSPQPTMGLMTSLPLIWPLGAEFGALARGEVESPWQNTVMSECFSILPLDTLSPIPAIDPALPDTDPLAGLKNLAVIQPRGLSPADNVALDDWVRAGGRLLLVLDPMLTGEYELALGDPRRPNGTALIPPVVKRWGLSINFDEDDESTGHSHDAGHHHHSDVVGHGPIAFGTIARTGPSDVDCEIAATQIQATCKVGEGRVTLYADAAIFEHRDSVGTDAGQNAEAIRVLMQSAFR